MTDVQGEDDDYFIIFEQDFEDWDNGDITDVGLDRKITQKLGRMGYRVMKQKPNAEEMQDAIWAEIKNGGEVIFYGIDTDSEDGEFSKLSEDDDPTVELYELNKALYLIGDFDSGYSWVTPHTSNEDEMLVVPDIGGNEIDSNLMSHMGIDERAFKEKDSSVTPAFTWLPNCSVWLMTIDVTRHSASALMLPAAASKASR